MLNCMKSFLPHGLTMTTDSYNMTEARANLTRRLQHLFSLGKVSFLFVSTRDDTLCLPSNEIAVGQVTLFCLVTHIFTTFFTFFKIPHLVQQKTFLGKKKKNR